MKLVANKVKDIALDCGVSEQAIRSWCRRNNVAKDSKASFVIDEMTKNHIYEHYLGDGYKQVSQHAKDGCETCETMKNTLISMLRQELDNKNKQLEVKDRQIEELNLRLAESNAALVAAQQTAQAAQALHAGTMQKQLLEENEGMGNYNSDSKEIVKTGWIKKMLKKKR